MKHILLALSLATAMAPPATAQELVLSPGYADYSHAGAQDAAILSIDYHHAPFLDRGRFSLGWGAAVEADAAGDLFAGIGAVGTWTLGNGWFIEGTVFPGLYAEDLPGNGLGSGFEIRSLLGVGRTLRNGDKLSLAIAHKSNAGTANPNPGMNAVFLRWHRPL